MIEKIKDTLHTTDNRIIRADRSPSPGITTKQIFPAYKDPYFKERSSGTENKEEDKDNKKQNQQSGSGNESKDPSLRNLENIFVIYDNQGRIVGDSPKKTEEERPIITRHINQNA